MDAARQKEMCDSLIQWFATLQLSAPHRTALELSDGVAMAQALHQLAPDTFTGAWLAKIKFEVGSNWRLKVSNLKKVSAGSMEYYADCLQLQLAYFRPPDVLAIAEKQDHRELGVLLQLVLGCAVNCPDKQDYITAIMGLEESLQRNIMTALQQLETVWQGARSATSPTSGQRTSLSIGSSGVGGSPSSSAASAATLDTLTGAATAAGDGVGGDVAEQRQLQLSADRADVLAQRCHEAERRVALLLDEKCTLQQEVAKMQEELDRGALHAGGGGLHAVAAIGDDGVSLGPVQPGSTRYTELRRQLDAMKDELLMAETQRDDFKIRAAQQEKEMVGLQQRVDELSKTADELVTVKDEMDALRESADRLKVCEAQLVTFKKKLEEYNDLRRQVKLLEERSAEYLQQNAVQEEQLKKGAALKGQVELYKLEIAELHGKLDAEMMRSVKTEFELSNAAARCAALQRETDGLLLERDQLRETCDELRCTQMRPTEGGIDGGGAETMRTAMLRSGEMQKKKMKERYGGESGQGDGGEVGAETSEEHRAFLAQFMDESNQRIEKLREQLKVANQRILFHEAQAAATGSLEAAAVAGQDAVVLQQLKLALEQNERKASQLDDAHTNLAQHEHKIAQLEAALLAREQELAAADARHRKSVEKTKEIIQSYDPKLTGDYSLSDKLSGLDNGNEPTLPVRPPIDSVEERLMGTAFYRLSQSCHRDAMEARLALLNGAGQSFLNRQRQPAARKSQNGGGGGGGGAGVPAPFKK